MATMRAATLVAPFKMEVGEMPRPEVDDESVIVRLEGMGICGSNLHWWNGGGPATAFVRYPLPGAGCHEFAGVVAEVGRNVTLVRPGDRVAVDQFESSCCTACSYCKSGFFQHCTSRTSRSLEGYLEYLKTSERGLYRLPDNVETAAAAVVEPFACSIAALRRAGMPKGARVAVLGAGVLGLGAAGAARALGAGRVVITAKYPAQEALAARFGVDAVVPSGSDRLAEQIQEALGGPADMAVETVGGHAPTFSQALDAIRPCGTIVVLGLWDEMLPVDSWKCVLKDARVLFSLTHGLLDGETDYSLALRWMASREVPAQDLVTHLLPLERIEEGFRLASDKSSGVVKVVVTP
ncbi:MAG: alcohol dehydrogenase catalytic domain-containing protein [Dehalococcoidia bacterium]|nr:alcohol dehydrogenase catalytic domain-containing protein [Dehalococcoidia bacterium]